MQVARERLVAAFTQLDEAIASSITSSMMAIYPLEQVCSELITPTMWQIGQLWADGVISISVEHFACNFFRALLTNLLHLSPILPSAPLAIVCCAPGEPHELAPLMLSLFLRRDGLRIVYLGQNIESIGLMQTIRQLEPALLCVSLTMPEYLVGLLDLAQRIAALPQPRPLFAFGGQGVTYTPDVISRIPGIYLAGNLSEIVMQLQSVLVKQTENKN
jgi:methanogenic corrinoid protein MtbC1